MNRLANRHLRRSEPRSRARRVGLLLMTIALAAGCAAGRGAFRQGLEAELVRDYETALTHYERALEEKPGDIEYRLKVAQARFAAAFAHFENGRRALNSGHLEAARMEFIRAMELDPTHDLARTELERVEAMMAAGTDPAPAAMPDFEVRKEAARTDPSLGAQLDPMVTGPITLRITQEAQAIFETIGEISGLNVIFDPDFRSTRVSVELEDLTVYEALDIMALQTRTFWKPLNSKTIIVAPENQQKRREYESHVLKTVYLTNSVNPTDITEAITAIRTLLNMRFIAQSTSMNAIILRDTADKIAIAEKIIDDIDKSKPEVLVEATVLEVDRNRLRELGILPPQSTSLAFEGGTAPPSSGNGGGQTTGNRRVNLRDLDAINSGSFSIVIPDTVARFLESDSHTRLVQNPSVRATDGKQASIRIGSRVPVASGSFQPAFVGATGTPVVQFQYIDVGVNMDITPRVLLNREISMSVLVQVQATAGNNIISGVALPVFTNRSVTHEIRLQEGETNILGGLITDTESTALSGVPGLSRIPVLKHLFGSETRQRDQTEIIVLLTPHIVKMPDITERNLRGILVGTETDTRFRGMDDRQAAPSPAPASSEPDPASSPLPSPPAAGDVPPGDGALSFPEPVLTLPAGMTAELTVQVNASNVRRADLTIDYDPSRVALVAVNEGGFLSRDGAGVAVLQNIDTERGRAIVSLERPERTAGVTGGGDLMRLTLEGVASGESAIRLSGFRVIDAAAGERSGTGAEMRVIVP